MTFTDEEIRKILTDFPQSVLKYSEYAIKTLKLGEINDMDDDDVKALIPQLIQFNPRGLYEFFDSNKIYPYSFMQGVVWKGNVYIKDTQAQYVSEDEFDTRIDAEKQAMLVAFKTLEG